MSYEKMIAGRKYEFSSLKELLAMANETKSGDALAGIAAHSESQRIAAKEALADVRLRDLRSQPVIPYEQDEVTRFIDDHLDEAIFDQIKAWTVAELREFILSAPAPPESLSLLGKEPDSSVNLNSIRFALTGEMAAAVCKIMSNMDLVLAARKLPVRSVANTTLGGEGVLGARLQPNHPADSIEGILASMYEGLAFGVGDAVIGINPAYDTADTVGRLLESVQKVIDALAVPTQSCVLSHVTTQMKALQSGAPAGLIFQSIAGSEKGNTAFGINLEMLIDAHKLGKTACCNRGKQVMYFETGQGSELSSRSHNDADQLTLEARCYAMARHFQPFLVNDVVGFIGPEYLADGKQMIRAGLEDHFMGKLLGVPMGVDACYTNHMDADQNDLENLSILLTAAGVNYFMGVPMGDDVMLSYQTTSYHDIASLRELMRLRPAPEFEAWLNEIGLMSDGKLTETAGDLSVIQALAMSRTTT